nr:hypothetical protein CFP56_63996 [Quercus suber]
MNAGAHFTHLCPATQPVVRYQEIALRSMTSVQELAAASGLLLCRGQVQVGNRGACPAAIQVTRNGTRKTTQRHHYRVRLPFEMILRRRVKQRRSGRAFHARASICPAQLFPPRQRLPSCGCDAVARETAPSISRVYCVSRCVLSTVVHSVPIHAAGILKSSSRLETSFGGVVGERRKFE